MIIAFCTTAMNRLWQVQETLPHNLQELRGTEHFIALCDYHSSDGLDAHVRRHFHQACAAGSLLYFSTGAPERFHASKAKNAAHRLALLRRADVLFNLDADNFITPATIAHAREVFAGGSGVLHHWSGVWGDGSFGRIGMSAGSWLALGGYDETLREMTWQDIDLLVRGRALGLRYQVRASGVKPALKNTTVQKLANGAAAAADEPTAAARLRQLNACNFVRSLSRPVRLSVDEQERYPGRVNFEREVVL